MEGSGEGAEVQSSQEVRENVSPIDRTKKALMSSSAYKDEAAQQTFRPFTHKGYDRAIFHGTDPYDLDQMDLNDWAEINTRIIFKVDGVFYAFEVADSKPREPHKPKPANIPKRVFIITEYGGEHPDSDSQDARLARAYSKEIIVGEGSEATDKVNKFLDVLEKRIEADETK